ncbi:MAG: DUF4238 domain-containing protein [Acidimicrobiales bacterium]
MADKNIPRRQHTVSQGILRQFTEPTTGQLESYNLIDGKAHRKYPVQVGFVWNFVEHEPTATEKRWQGTEVRLPSLYAALSDGTLLDQPDMIELAKEVIALHVVRSLTRRAVHEVVVPRAREDLVRELRHNPEAFALAFLRRTGFHAAGSEALEAQVQWEADRALHALDTPEFWQARLMANIDELNALLSRTSIQVFEAGVGSGEFLIADDPAPTMMAGHRGLGPLAGVSYARTTTIALPVSPKYAIALIEQPEWREADSRTVHFLNCVQLSYAKERVFYSPLSGLRALAQRAPAARLVRPEGLGPLLITLDPLVADG